MDEMEEKQKSGGYFTPVRVVFWLLMTTILAFVGYVALTAGNHRGSDRACCIMNQRNIQQMVRAYQDQHHLKPGASIDWAELIGPGKYMGKKPACPVHGEYTYSPVIPETGVLAATCQDPNHRQTDIQGW